MTRHPLSPLFRRWLAAVLSVLIGYGPLLTPAYAALTPLADEPLNIRSHAKPNVVLTVDDSTSMLDDFLPDASIVYPAGSLFGHCRGGTGGMGPACGSFGSSSDFSSIGAGKYFSPGYTFQQYGIPYPTYTGVGSYDASGPGAGCQGGTTPTCSPGVDPGPLPGIGTYPASPPGGPTSVAWPKAGNPYEYWLLWPAPAHNGAANTMYYDPRITYSPPVDSTGTSYALMDAAHTANWTSVPADPWAATVTYVDLTAQITIGLWCNSDWSLGSATDPTQCRVNGSGAAAFGTVTAPDGVDYTYPWAPPGFATSASAGPTTLQTYAAQKVTLSTDGTLTGTAVNATNWTAAAQNQKYFYENENILWCDPTNAAWPQTGAVQTQTCIGYVAQTCNGSITQTCNGTQSQTCVGAQTQTCVGTAVTCNAGTCVNQQTCVGQQAQTCNQTAQTCNGTAQTCNVVAQTCSGPFAQTCNLPGTKTCLPQVCTVNGYSPTGLPPATNCNLLPPSPENPCLPITTCVPPECTLDPGKCSLTGAKCTAATLATDCPAQPGKCSVTTGTSCMSATDCANIGTCSSDHASCSTSANCLIVGGTCSVSGASCTSNSGPGSCSSSGKCSIQTATTCTSNGQCNTIPGHCSVTTTTSCTSNGQCPAGTCAAGAHAACNGNNVCGVCSNSPGTNCQSVSQCPATNHCSIQTATACVRNSDCNTIPGHCSVKTTTSCTGNGGCSTVPGSCSSDLSSCQVNSDCNPIPGSCNLIAQSCKVNSDCQQVGHCSGSGAQCTSNFGCPSTQGPLPPNAAVCSTTGVGGVATATLRNDAENNGVVCRRNNHAYTGVTAGPYNYPSGKYLTPITGGTGTDACTTTNHYASVPRHYWKTQVQWCDNTISTAGDKWLGYGTGSCQAGKDTTHIYPQFYQFGTVAFVDNYVNAAFQRVDLDITKRATATYTHTWYNTVPALQTITRTFDQEMTNYATWFAYYRDRILAVKSITALVFNNLDANYRVGFHTLSNGMTTPVLQSDPATFVNVADFTPTQRTAWYAQLFGIKIPLELQTPTLDAMGRIGEYFLNGTNAALPGSTDPINLSCQKNWHMLFTDGFTNQIAPVAPLPGDQDNTVPTLPDPVVGLTTGMPWPHPYVEDLSSPTANSASSYAMKYWVTDLRTTGPNATDNVPTSSKDPAPWQHLNFAAMSLGTEGKLPTANPALTENQLSSGALQWPVPYPNVYKPDNSGVDDLWHAAMNGRGRFVNANSPDELKIGMGQILQDVTNQSGSRAAGGLTGSTVSAGNNTFYRVTFQPGWGGDVDKVSFDIVTGIENPIPVWDAATQLGSQLTITATAPTPWFSARKIFTVNDAGTAVPFLWANLSAAQQNTLAPGSAPTGQAVLSFLRGDPTNEGALTGQFRVRARISSGEDFLGDIVDSSAVFVGPPNSPYLDANDPGYSTFVSNQASRPARVYVGANDGMLHAIDDTNGNEAWAFVPHDFYRVGATGLSGLSLQDGALPAFHHHFYVDSTPRIIDANFGGGSADWHTLVVGGFGKGGKSYYALDVTNPASVIDEGSAAAQFLWQFTDSDMGYTFGRPMIAKTRAFGGAWVVVAPAGYDNPSGVGRIYFINAATGALLKTMTTGFGSATSPSGLAQISGYTKDFHNQLIEQIYGGDLYGNFWRFDVSDPNPANWTVAKLANLTDPGGNPQPVTTAPEIKIDVLNGIDRWVFIGTGRLLDSTDETDPTIAGQQQTFYAIRDGTTNAPNAITVALQPRTDFVLLADRTMGLSARPAKGWYDDLPTGQRIVANVQAAAGVVAYVATSAQTDPCLTGLPATLYVRGYSTGNSLLNDTGGNAVSGFYVPGGASDATVVFFPPGADGSVDIRIAITGGTTGDLTFQKISPPPLLRANRMSWRLLGQ